MNNAPRRDTSITGAGVAMEKGMTRYALITGASSGIGLALAEALARRGRSLILVARQRDQLESIAIELTQRFGVEVLFRACDLGEPLRLSGFLLELEEGERQIDLLVNCAGIGTSGPFLAQDWMTEQDLIEVNILALTRMCHAIGNSHGAAGRRADSQCCLGRGVPTRPVDEQLLRQQGVCAAFLRRFARRTRKPAASRSRCCAPARPAPLFSAPRKWTPPSSNAANY